METEQWAGPNEGSRTWRRGLCWNPQGWGKDSNSTVPVPSTLHIPTRRQQASRVAKGGVRVWDKARLDPAAHSKKSLVQRRPALRGRSSCCPEAWAVARLAGTAPEGREA